ncbi:hypothetical protein PVK06_020626 [Gossypium arboreum]|uniref:Uncharacterized protein n=1 Tax=Gossypium arboreum TaxID=29729 RepID=A0ABR0PN89_GOSAR|nr:hypothetical protein PVK06_020626 [Gossypium arboreum]
MIEISFLVNCAIMFALNLTYVSSPIEVQQSWPLLNYMVAFMVTLTIATVCDLLAPTTTQNGLRKVSEIKLVTWIRDHPTSFP